MFKPSRKLLASLSVASLLTVGAVSVNEASTVSTVQASVVSKKLTHNAYIYKANGKKFSKKTLKKSKKVKIYGTKTIKGKKYYRIGKNQYVKVANFKKVISTVTGALTSNQTSTSNNATATSNIATTPKNVGDKVVKSNSQYTTYVDKNGKEYIVVKPKQNGQGQTSNNSTNTPISTTKPNTGTSDLPSNGQRYNGDITRSSMLDSPTFTASDEARARKNQNKSVYFTDSEVKQIEDRLWDDLQNYRESKGYPAFKKNAELSKLAEQAQVPKTPEFNRFSDSFSQNLNDFKTFLPGLARQGMDQSIGYVDSGIYCIANPRAIIWGGNMTHAGYKPTQVADMIFNLMKKSPDYSSVMHDVSKMMYGWKEQHAYGALHVHYYWRGDRDSSIGISLFTVDGTSPEWISAWNKD